MTLSTSPLHEELAIWRAVNQNTVEDWAEFDRILSRHRNPDTAIAHILTRIAEDDVPLNVAADIDQIVWEQDNFITRRTYALVPDDADGYVPADLPPFETAAAAAGALAPWMRAHIVTRVTVESPISGQAAHVEQAQPRT